MKTRIYEVRLFADKDTFIENEKIHSFKRKYVEYIEPVKLVTESQLIKLIKTGQVQTVRLTGAIRD